jgi:hypothetical protein
LATTTQTPERVQNDWLDAGRLGQDVIVETLRIWSDAVHRALAVPTGLPGRFDVAAFVDTGFDLAERLLANQRDLAHQLLGAAEQVREVTERRQRAAVDHVRSVADETTRLAERGARQVDEAAQAAQAGSGRGKDVEADSREVS